MQHEVRAIRWINKYLTENKAQMYPLHKMILHVDEKKSRIIDVFYAINTHFSHKDIQMKIRLFSGYENSSFLYRILK